MRNNQHKHFLAIGIYTSPKTTMEASASSSVHLFTLPLAGESGYQARRVFCNLNQAIAPPLQSPSSLVPRDPPGGRVKMRDTYARRAI